MRLTPEMVKEFQQIILEEYGVEMSEGDAAVLGTQLLNFYEFLARPTPEELAEREAAKPAVASASSRSSEPPPAGPVPGAA